MPVMASLGVESLQLEAAGRSATPSRPRCATATVAMRQWWSSSLLLPAGPSPGPNSPMTVWVLPTSMATSTAQRLQVEADVEHRRGVGEGADRDEVGAGRRVGGDRCPGSRRPETSTGQRPATSATAAATSAGLMLSTQHQVGAGLDGHLDLLEGVALDLARSGRASGAGPAPPPPRWRRPARWLSLSRMPSESEPRWLAPPPARTAAFSRARRPGVVLRVSRMRAVGPAASTKRRVRVATPERWPSRLRAVRSAVSTDASGPLDPARTCPASSSIAVGRRPAAPRSRGRRRRRSRWRQPAGQHARGSGDQGGGRPSAAAGTRLAVTSPKTPRSSARARATTSRTAVTGGSSQLAVIARTDGKRPRTVAGKSSRGVRPGSPPGPWPPRPGPGPPRPGWRARPGPGGHGGDLVRGRRPARRRVRTTPAPRSWPAAAAPRPLAGSAGLVATAGPDGWEASAPPIAPGSDRVRREGRGGGRRSRRAPLSPRARLRRPGPRTPCPRAASSRPGGWRRGRPCRPPRRRPTGPGRAVAPSRSVRTPPHR